MKRQTPRSGLTFLAASLAASDVGTWDYDVGADRLRYCRAMADLYGLPPEGGRGGVPRERIAAATHPDDRALSQAQRAHLFRHGGAFVMEHRILPAPRVTRWVLVRGFYELDASGRGLQGRGIVVDMTAVRQNGSAEPAPVFVTEADDEAISALDRATQHVLASRRALRELDPDATRDLQSAADALLLEVARHIAGTLVPAAPRRTEH